MFGSQFHNNEWNKTEKNNENETSSQTNQSNEVMHNSSLFQQIDVETKK